MTVSAPARGALPLPPPEYSQQYQNGLIRQLETIFRQLDNPGPLICAPDLSPDSRAQSGLNIKTPAISVTGSPPAGLISGDVWGDASGSAKTFTGTGSVSGNVLTIVASPSPTGTLAVGNGVTGSLFPRGTRVLSLGSGTGGAGTYILSESFTAASTTVTGFSSPFLRIVP